MIEESDMSDEELQEAFAAGLIKPGLNIPYELKTFKNNVVALREILREFKRDLPWIEKMDIVSKPAAIAPEMHHELTEAEKLKGGELPNHWKPSTKSSTPKESIVFNDFKREMLFHRQAQATVIEGIARLHQLGVPTKRPDDYFAEMAKPDDHMQKVRESLAARQAGAVRSERIGQIRRQRKLSKQIQIENKLKQQEEKKKLDNEVKKFRKGARKDLNFLENPKNNDKNRNSNTTNKRAILKRKRKDDKFGFGGKKRGMKRNTKESAAGIVKRSNKLPGKKNGPKMAKKRLGKSRRTKIKSKR